MEAEGNFLDPQDPSSSVLLDLCHPVIQLHQQGNRARLVSLPYQHYGSRIRRRQRSDSSWRGGHGWEGIRSPLQP